MQMAWRWFDGDPSSSFVSLPVAIDHSRLVGKLVLGSILADQLEIREPTVPRPADVLHGGGMKLLGRTSMNTKSSWRIGRRRMVNRKDPGGLG